jgi:hypothetical protein
MLSGMRGVGRCNLLPLRPRVLGRARLLAAAAPARTVAVVGRRAPGAEHVAMILAARSGRVWP